MTPAAACWSAPQEVDADFDFEQVIGDIHVELADRNREVAGLDEKMQQDLKELGA